LTASDLDLYDIALGGPLAIGLLVPMFSAGVSGTQAFKSG